MATRIQLRRDTAANWTSVDPVLAAGEVGVEEDTGKHKIGDGATAWSALPYFIDETVLRGTYQLTRTQSAQALPGLRKVATYARYPSFVHAGGKVACLGDSTTLGVGAPGANAVNVGSYPAQLPARLSALGLPAVKGLAIPAAGNGGAALDSRFSTTGTAWSIPTSNSSPGWANIASYGALAASTGTLVFDGSGQTVDSFAVYYLTYPGNGSANATVNGGAATAINTSATAGWGVTFVTCTPGTANILTINAPTGGSVYIVGIDPINTQSGALRIANIGIGGAKAADFVTSPVLAAFNSLDGLKLYAPDVTVLMLGVNDAVAAVSSSAWAASIQSIITAAKVSGDVILMSCVPSDPVQNSTAIVSAEQSYQAQCLALAQSNGCVFLDLFARLGSYATYNAQGFAAGGGDPGRHLSGLGYADVALAVAGALTSV